MVTPDCTWTPSLPADIRLRAVGERAHISWGGDAPDSRVPVGWAHFADAVTVVGAILD